MSKMQTTRTRSMTVAVVLALALAAALLVGLPERSHRQADAVRGPDSVLTACRDLQDRAAELETEYAQATEDGADEVLSSLERLERRWNATGCRRVGYGDLSDLLLSVERCEDSFTCVGALGVVVGPG